MDGSCISNQFIGHDYDGNTYYYAIITKKTKSHYKPDSSSKTIAPFFCCDRVILLYKIITDSGEKWYYSITTTGMGGWLLGEHIALKNMFIINKKYHNKKLSFNDGDIYYVIDYIDGNTFRGYYEDTYPEHDKTKKNIYGNIYTHDNVIYFEVKNEKYNVFVEKDKISVQ